MKRTQLYIDDQIFYRLFLISKQKGVTISDLVRKAIHKVYGKQKLPVRSIDALKASSGLWANRKDMGPTEQYIRSLRTGSRARRLGLS